MIKLLDLIVDKAIECGAEIKGEYLRYKIKEVTDVNEDVDIHVNFISIKNVYSFYKFLISLKDRIYSFIIDNLMLNDKYKDILAENYTEILRIGVKNGPYNVVVNLCIVVFTEGRVRYSRNIYNELHALKLTKNGIVVDRDYLDTILIFLGLSDSAIIERVANNVRNGVETLYGSFDIHRLLGLLKKGMKVGGISWLEYLETDEICMVCKERVAKIKFSSCFVDIECFINYLETKSSCEYVNSFYNEECYLEGLPKIYSGSDLA